jgi:hypothetical protein
VSAEAKIGQKFCSPIASSSVSARTTRRASATTPRTNSGTWRCTPTLSPATTLEDLVGAEVGTATALVVSLPRKRGSRYVATGVLIFAGQAGVRVYAL